MRRLPKEFCWSRMGAEAGELLDIIILRKELERSAGDGIFIWGIGNSLGRRFWEFISGVRKPKVLFSRIKSDPKSYDSNPTKICLWASYKDRYGNHFNLPDHVLVLSRAYSNSLIKKRHYALVCSKKERIDQEHWNPIDFSRLKNFNSRQNNIGYSQVTAVVESNGATSLPSTTYDVVFSADLVDPYYITLLEPVEIPREEIARLDRLLVAGKLSATDWMAWLSELKNRYARKSIGVRSASQQCLPWLPITQKTSV